MGICMNPDYFIHSSNHYCEQIKSRESDILSVGHIVGILKMDLKDGKKKVKG